jgi:hypothetical protein
MSSSNTLVLKGKIEEPTYPKSQSEILREVIISDDFNILKGVYGKFISITGQGKILGPVYADEDISIKSPKIAGSYIRFNSGLSASNSLAIDGETIILDKPGSLENAKVYVKGDIVSDIIKIENTVVFGNLRGRKVIVNNSTVVGGIYADEQLILENSRVVSFTSGEVILKGTIYCWLPYGFSKIPMKMEDSLLANGKTILSRLIFTGFGDSQEMELGVGDIHLHKRDDDSEIYAINLGRRALNLKLIENEFLKVEKFITSILIFDQLDAHSQEIALRDWPKDMREEESKIFKKFCEN